MAVSGRLVETKHAVTSKGTFCEPCLDNEKHIKAHGLCEQCNEAMCRVCFKNHLAARVCRNHVFLENTSDSTDEDVGYDDRNIETCAKHGNETIKFYCRSHNVVGCAECMLKEGHNNCKPEYIRELCENFPRGRELRQFNERIARLERQNDEIKVSIHQNKTRNNEMKGNSVVNINEYFDEAIRELEKMKLALHSDACRRFEQNEEQFDRIQNVSESTDADICSIKQNIDTDTFHGASLFIQTINSEKTLAEMEKNIGDLITKTKLNTFDFVSRFRADLLKPLDYQASIEESKVDFIVQNDSQLQPTISNEIEEVIEEDMRIYVDTPTAGLITVLTKGMASVYDIKEEVFESEGIPVRSQTLMLENMVLDDYNTLNYYNIKNRSKLRLTFNTIEPRIRKKKKKQKSTGKSMRTSEILISISDI